MSTRKNASKPALDRFYQIDEEIASGKYPSARKLAETIGFSEATINRDLAFMRDRLYAPIEYSAIHRGLYYSEKPYRLPGAFTSMEDMQALGMAKNLLSLYHDTPLYDAAKNLLDSFTAPLASDKNPGWYEDRIIVPPVASAPVSEETWKVITAGLKENKAIIFEYQGAWDEEFKPRRVRPYQLLFDTGVWYLYAYAEERKAIRIFSLPRIKNPVLTKDTFTLPKDFDYCSNADGSNFGVFAGEKKCRFAIAIYGESIPWVQERKWAADQATKETDDGIIISFTSTQYGKVLEWVLSKGCNAMPLGPNELVQDWKIHINLMKKMAGKSTNPL
ncbi:helix-turn-helix transcriptional regulator [Leadbettera azotonutricia]|uniref:WYL domain-containing protein n=1 Tax=Leadbettera azotonutricia (strain ATCC BAA-888 / DSM 13862 / ZAS-9) TaxID=545695 RepID=F5Y8T9_LEAAZ|nr:WYL domain-containing protein [Leadbettera azotonutricia]AEF81107.1 hypothetical protein TREAZ_2167 [Leadbettera azotonutricia ZAS-9]